MGMMPVMISRATRLFRSTSFCMIRNLGMVTPMSTPIATAMTATATTRMDSSPTGFASTRTSEPIPMHGAKSTMRMHITSTIWICWMSFVARVMRDAAENLFISAGEKSSTRS